MSVDALSSASGDGIAPWMCKAPRGTVTCPVGRPGVEVERVKGIEPSS